MGSGILRSIGGSEMSNRVYIFDTTLRTASSLPDAGMTVPEKLRMHASWLELGVDILEAASLLPLTAITRL